MAFGCVLIEGETLTTDTYQARVWRDGTLVFDSTDHTDLDRIERIKPGWGRKWEVEVSGCVEIHRISLAGTPDELLGG